MLNCSVTIKPCFNLCNWQKMPKEKHGSPTLNYFSWHNMPWTCGSCCVLSSPFPATAVGLWMRHSSLQREIQHGFVTPHSEGSTIISLSSINLSVKCAKPHPAPFLFGVANLCRKLPPWPSPHTSVTPCCITCCFLFHWHHWFFWKIEILGWTCCNGALDLMMRSETYHFCFKIKALQKLAEAALFWEVWTHIKSWWGVFKFYWNEIGEKRVWNIPQEILAQQFQSWNFFCCGHP